jgi:hypothetical protein
MKLTEWYPADVKPVRVGVYQKYCGFGQKIGYQRWDGRRWMAWDINADVAQRETIPAANFYKDKWRGLAEKP